MQKEDFMVPKELARLLRTTKQALATQRCLRREHPPYVKIGKRILYPRDAVLAWLDSHQVNRTHEACEAQK
jgi:predicted DNA-binding transcriptional regulator AlpA